SPPLPPLRTVHESLPSHGSSRPLPSVLPEALSRMGRCVASGSVCRPLAGSHRTPLRLHPPALARFVTWRLRGSGTDRDAYRGRGGSAHDHSPEATFASHCPGRKSSGGLTSGPRRTSEPAWLAPSRSPSENVREPRMRIWEGGHGFTDGGRP